MKNITIFFSENFYFFVVKSSVYLNRHVFVMIGEKANGSAGIEEITILPIPSSAANRVGLYRQPTTNVVYCHLSI